MASEEDAVLQRSGPVVSVESCPSREDPLLAAHPIEPQGRNAFASEEISRHQRSGAVVSVLGS
jgi:hypothetical protein